MAQLPSELWRIIVKLACDSWFYNYHKMLQLSYDFHEYTIAAIRTDETLIKYASKNAQLYEHFNTDSLRHHITYHQNKNAIPLHASLTRLTQYIEHTPITQFKQLTYLISDNYDQIREVTQLRQLRMSANESIPNINDMLKQHTNLTELSLDGQYSVISIEIPSLTKLSIYGEFGDMPLIKCYKLRTLIFSQTIDQQYGIDFSPFKCLTDLDCEMHLDVHQCEQIVANCPLESLQVFSCVDIEFMLSNIPTLKNLSLTKTPNNNQFNIFPLIAKYTQIRELTFHCNPKLICQDELMLCTQLVRLKVDYVSQRIVQCLTQLTFLNTNNIVTPQLPNLKVLLLRNFGPIISLDTYENLANLSSLTTLTCLMTVNVLLCDLLLAPLTNLTNLTINFHQSNPTCLDISDNTISKMSQLQTLLIHAPTNIVGDGILALPLLSTLITRDRYNSKEKIKKLPFMKRYEFHAAA